MDMITKVCKMKRIIDFSLERVVEPLYNWMCAIDYFGVDLVMLVSDKVILAFRVFGNSWCIDVEVTFCLLL